MLTSTEKQQIRAILQDTKWTAIQNAAETLIQKIEDEYVVRDTEWETIKAALEREAQIKGIRRFFQDLYSQAQ